MEIMNQARGFAYLYGILKKQQEDPFCCSCNAFIKTLTAVRENLITFETQCADDISNLPGEFCDLFSEAKSGITQIRQPKDPVSQKKAGNCKLPEGVCFIKTSLSLLQKV